MPTTGLSSRADTAIQCLDHNYLSDGPVFSTCHSTGIHRARMQRELGECRSLTPIEMGEVRWFTRATMPKG